MEINWNLLVPDKINTSYLLFKNGKKCYIPFYKSMEISVEKTIHFVNGERQECFIPNISYKFQLDKESAIVFKHLLDKEDDDIRAEVEGEERNSSSNKVLLVLEDIKETFLKNICLEAYLCYIPGYLKRIIARGGYNDQDFSQADITIKVKQKPFQKVFYEDLQEKLKKLDRFEIMDLE